MRGSWIVSIASCLLSLAGASGQYGAAWIVATDFTGDGVGDLIVGDPGAAGGVGRLYVFHGVESGNPLPPPTEADQVVSLSAQSLRACGYRLAQACDLDIDGVPELMVGAKMLRDGQLVDRILVVNPRSFTVLQDLQMDANTVDPWDGIDGDCEFHNGLNNAFENAGVHGGDDGSLGSSYDSSSSGDGVIQFGLIADALFSWNPLTYLYNAGMTVDISLTASSKANALYPIDRENMPPSEIKALEGKRNAARHAFWQGMLTYYLGYDIAEDIGDAHEANSTNELDSWIDQYNNQVARDIAWQCWNVDRCTLEELIRRLLEAMEDGRFITSPCDPRVPPGLRNDPSRNGGVQITCAGYGGPVALGDVNSDGSTDNSDWFRLLSEFDTTNPVADLDQSGIVDAPDAAILADLLENDP